MDNEQEIAKPDDDLKTSAKERFKTIIGDKDYLSLSGGGMRCFCFVGPFKVFETLFCDKEETFASIFDGIEGASGGSFVGLLLASGLSTDEMEILSKDDKLRKYLFKENVLNLLPYNGPAGLNDGENIKTFLKNTLREKGVLSETENDLTFADYKLRTNKSLSFAVSYMYVEDILSCTLNARYEMVGNREEDQQELVIETCVDSMRISPLIMPRFDYVRGRYAYDGGFYCNVPTNGFDRNKTFYMRPCVDPQLERTEILRMMNTRDESRSIENIQRGNMNLLEFMKNVIFTYTNHLEKAILDSFTEEEKEYAILNIPVLASHCTDFDMPSTTVEKLIRTGKEVAKDFVKKIVSRNITNTIIDKEQQKQIDKNNSGLTIETLFKPSKPIGE